MQGKNDCAAGAGRPSGSEGALPEPPEDAGAAVAEGGADATRWVEALAWARRLRPAGERLRGLRDKGVREVQRALGAAGARLPPTALGVLCGVADSQPLTAENLLLAYAQGLFPLDFGGKLRWSCPSERFVLYLDELRISANMRRELRRASYTTSFDRAPREVLEACADREETWLSERLRGIYLELFDMGAMHSVEVWRGGDLVGGSFGLAIGRVWMGESMFHRAPHAGKVAFAALAAHLEACGYVCADGQLYSEHMARFGAREVPIAEYRTCLARGLAQPARFAPAGAQPASDPPRAPAGSSSDGLPGGGSRRGPPRAA